MWIILVTYELLAICILMVVYLCSLRWNWALLLEPSSHLSLRLHICERPSLVVVYQLYGLVVVSCVSCDPVILLPFMGQWWHLGLWAIMIFLAQHSIPQLPWIHRVTIIRGPLTIVSFFFNNCLIPSIRTIVWIEAIARRIIIELFLW